jgi:hypothetical protein
MGNVTLGKRIADQPQCSGISIRWFSSSHHRNASAAFLASFGFEALQSDTKLSLRAIPAEMQAQGFVDENGEAYSAADIATMLGHGLGRYKAAG